MARRSWSAASATPTRYAASQEWLAANGGLMVHAYDQFETLAGQGTVALELGARRPNSIPCWSRSGEAG